MQLSSKKASNENMQNVITCLLSLLVILGSKCFFPFPCTLYAGFALGSCDADRQVVNFVHRTICDETCESIQMSALQPGC